MTRQHSATDSPTIRRFGPEDRRTVLVSRFVDEPLPPHESDGNAMFCAESTERQHDAGITHDVVTEQFPATSQQRPITIHVFKREICFVPGVDVDCIRLNSVSREYLRSMSAEVADRNHAIVESARFDIEQKLLV